MKKAKDKKNVFSAIKLLWKVMTKRQKFLCFPLFIMLMARPFALLMPVQCIASITSKIEGKQAVIFGIGLPLDWSVEIIAIFSFSLVFIFWLIGLTAYYCLWAASGKLTNQLNDKALQWTLSPRKNCDIQMTKGEFCYLIKSATESISNFVETLFISIIPPLASFVLSVVYIGLIDWIVMLIVLSISVVLLLFAYTRVKLDRKYIVNEEVYKGRINNLFLNSVTNLPFLSLFKCQFYENAVLSKHNRDYYSNLKKRTYIQWVYWAFVILFEYGSMALAIVVANGHSRVDMFSVSSAILLLGYILNVYNPIESLGYNISNLQQGAIKINRVILAKPNQTELITPTKNKLTIDKIEKIEILDLCIQQGAFRLEHVNLTLNKGEMLALAGASGCGKTSVMQALLGLKEHRHGKIIINDEIEVESLFFDDDRISYALQEMQLFDMSLEENIFYPNLPKTKEAVYILKSLGLDKLIKRNETISNDMELKFSGGERKRVNLARAMIKPAQVYIFDEPTNELDEKNVKIVIELLNKLKDKAIVVVISHDARLTDNCNKVIYF